MTYKRFRKTIEEMSSDRGMTPEDMNDTKINIKKIVYNKDLEYVGEQEFEIIGLSMDNNIVFIIHENGVVK